MMERGLEQEPGAEVVHVVARTLIDDITKDVLLSILPPSEGAQLAGADLALPEAAPLLQHTTRGGEVLLGIHEMARLLVQETVMAAESSPLLMAQYREGWNIAAFHDSEEAVGTSPMRPGMIRGEGSMSGSMNISEGRDTDGGDDGEAVGLPEGAMVLLREVRMLARECVQNIMRTASSSVLRHSVERGWGTSVGDVARRATPPGAALKLLHNVNDVATKLVQAIVANVTASIITSTERMGDRTIAPAAKISAATGGEIINQYDHTISEEAVGVLREVGQLARNLVHSIIDQVTASTLALSTEHGWLPVADGPGGDARPVLAIGEAEDLIHHPRDNEERPPIAAVGPSIEVLSRQKAAPLDLNDPIQQEGVVIGESTSDGPAKVMEGATAACAFQQQQQQQEQRRSSAPAAQSPPPPRRRSRPKGERHETSKLQRIRRQLPLRRPHRSTATYVAPRIAITTLHPSHESARIKRIHRQAKVWVQHRQRAKALQAQDKDKPRKRRSLPLPHPRGSGPSLVTQYLLHTLSIARAGGVEALLHYGRLADSSPRSLFDTLMSEDAANRPTRAIVSRVPSQPATVVQQSADGATTPAHSGVDNQKRSNSRSGDQARKGSVEKERRESRPRQSSSSSSKSLLKEYLSLLLQARLPGREDGSHTHHQCFRMLHDHHQGDLRRDPVAFLFGLAPPRHHEEPSPPLRVASQHFSRLATRHTTADMQIVTTSYARIRSARLSSTLTALLVLAIAEDGNLLSVTSRLATYLVDEDRRRLAPCSKAAYTLSNVIRRIQASATRLQSKARQKQAKVEVQKRREEREAAVKIQTVFRGHMHGRLRVSRLALREARRRALGLDVDDIAEILSSSTQRCYLDVASRLEMTRALCLKLQAVVAQSPAAARALIDLGFMQDLVDQLKDDKQLTDDLTATLLTAIHALLPGIPRTQPSALLSRAFVVRAVVTLLTSSTDPADVRSACTFLSALTSQRCLAFPGAYKEAGVVDALLYLLAEPLDPLTLLHQPFSVIDRVKQWGAASSALHNIHQNSMQATTITTSTSTSTTMTPLLGPLLTTCGTNLWLLNLCLTSAPLRLTLPPPQLHHIRATCLDTASSLNSLLLHLFTSTSTTTRKGGSGYTFSDSATDADLLLVLEKLLRLPHNIIAHETAITIINHLCQDPRARAFFVRCSLVDSVRHLLDEYDSGKLRVAAEDVIKTLTRTILMELPQAEEDGRLTAQDRQVIEEKALQGIYRALVE